MLYGTEFEMRYDDCTTASGRLYMCSPRPLQTSLGHVTFFRRDQNVQY